MCQNSQKTIRVCQLRMGLPKVFGQTPLKSIRDFGKSLEILVNFAVVSERWRSHPPNVQASTRRLICPSFNPKKGEYIKRGAPDSVSQTSPRATKKKTRASPANRRDPESNYWLYFLPGPE